ncbi:hypothetical protein GCM10009608_33230 [Pseudonocardia alaniniphila]
MAGHCSDGRTRPVPTKNYDLVSGLCDLVLCAATSRSPTPAASLTTTTRPLVPAGIGASTHSYADPLNYHPFGVGTFSALTPTWS